MEKVDRMSLVTLREELEKLELSTKGSKAVLKYRLMSAVLQQKGDEEEEEEEGEQNSVDNEVTHEDDNEDEEETKPRTKRHTTFAFKDVEDSFEKFDGLNMRVSKWCDDFEDMAKVLQWNNLQKFVYAKKLIVGTAQRFLRSERNITTWQVLRKKLIREFSAAPNSAEVHRKLMKEKMKTDDDVLNYFYTMREIAQAGSIESKMTKEIKQCCTTQRR